MFAMDLVSEIKLMAYGDDDNKLSECRRTVSI